MGELQESGPGKLQATSTTMSPTKLHFLPSLIKFLGPLCCLLPGFPDLVICSLAEERNTEEQSAREHTQSPATSPALPLALEPSGGSLVTGSSG